MTTNEAANVRRLYVDSRFGQMHLRIAQPETDILKRRPLLCFHMTPLSGLMFESWLGEMGCDRIAIAVDGPGFGCSDKLSSAPSMADYASAMADVLDSSALGGLGLSGIDLLGYHTGGRIAVQLAMQRPSIVRHIVLVGAGMYSKEQQEKHYASFSPNEVHDDGSHLVDTWNSMMRWRGPHRSLEDLMESYPDMIRGRRNQHLMYKANTEFSLAAHLKEIHQPILALNPRDDLWPYTPLIAPHLKDVDQLINLPDWGIGFLDYHTKEVAQMVRRFVDE